MSGAGVPLAASDWPSRPAQSRPDAPRLQDAVLAVTVALGLPLAFIALGAPGLNRTAYPLVALLAAGVLHLSLIHI